MMEERINRYLSNAGYCSRREADRLVEAGEVYIQGERAVQGQKVQEGEEVTVKGKRILKQEPAILLLYYKPKGIVCTTSKKDPDNVVDAIHYSSRIYPVGRLDKESEGLLLMTNQGELMDEILRARNHHEKEYQVMVHRPITQDVLEQMAQGVRIMNTKTRPCQVIRTGANSFTIVLTQGLNRQIRRMCEAFGYRVRSLKRVRIMNLSLGNLKPGEYRAITPEELRDLKKQLEGKRDGSKAKKDERTHYPAK